MKEIITKNACKVRQIIKKITGEYNEDIEQDIYVKIYLNLSKYKEQNKFTQWVCTIAANLCRDYLRSSKYKLASNCVADDELLNRLKATSDVEKEYTSKERQKIILKAINSLPKKMKEVIILYEFEDYSYEEISNKLKVPLGTVKSRMNNARKILQEKLEFLIK